MPQTLNDPRFRVNQRALGSVQVDLVIIREDDVATSTVRTAVTNAHTFYYTTVAEREVDADMRALGMAYLASEEDETEFVPDV